MHVPAGVKLSGLYITGTDSGVATEIRYERRRGARDGGDDEAVSGRGCRRASTPEHVGVTPRGATSLPAGHRYDVREIDISKAYIQLPLDKHKKFLLQKNLQHIRFSKPSRIS